MAPFEINKIEAYLSRLGHTNVRVLSLRSLTSDAEGDALKTFGYGQPLLIEFQSAGNTLHAVLRTMSENAFGHEHLSDRARGLLLDYTTFNHLPRHIHAYDFGALTHDHTLISLGQAEEFFLLTNYQPGTLYADDLVRIRDEGELRPGDVERARSLASYLADIHGVKHPEDAPRHTALWQRRIRDLVGHGEGIMGLIDSYPPDYPLASPTFLARVEHTCLDWRWRLKMRTNRLSLVHGDFHPFNVLFREGADFGLLDRSRGEWGEPGDDVSCMALNYVFFSLQRFGTLTGPFAELHQSFWETYLAASDDREVLTTVPPFLAWRGLVLASPLWYHVTDVVRQSLFRFIQNVLAVEAFEPERVHDYLK